MLTRTVSWYALAELEGTDPPILVTPDWRRVCRQARHATEHAGETSRLVIWVWSERMPARGPGGPPVAFCRETLAWTPYLDAATMAPLE